MRQRDIEFCETLIARTIRNGGRMSDDVLIESANDTWELPRYSKPLGVQEPRNRAMQLRKARSKLRKPDIKAKIAEIYQDQGFDLVDALQTHIAHIKGIAYKTTVIGKDGEAIEVEMREKPNYQALKDYLGMVLPKAPTTVNVNQKTVQVTGTPADFDRSSAPSMTPRVLGKAKVE